MQSIRLRYIVPCLIAATMLAACSSDNVTAPTTPTNDELIAHFDSLMQSDGGSPINLVYYSIVEILAQGSPVTSGTITVNGATKHVFMVSEREIGMMNGEPADSEYVVAAWEGDGADTAMEFFQSGGSTVSSIAVFGDTFGQSLNGSGSVTPGSLGAECTTYTAPDDITLPPATACHLQPSSDSFSILMQGDSGATVTVPSQTIKGIRVEIAEGV